MSDSTRLVNHGLPTHLGSRLTEDENGQTWALIISQRNSREDGELLAEALGVDIEQARAWAQRVLAVANSDA